MKAKIISIQRKWLIKREAMEYVGLGRTKFDELASKEGLTVSALNQKTKWFRVDELDQVIEKNIIKKSLIRTATGI